jgi:plasmid stability protein
MPNLTILDDELKGRLRMQAARRGLSMEEVVCRILSQSLNHPQQAKGLGSRIRQRFSTMGGIDLGLPERSDLPRTADMG